MKRFTGLLLISIMVLTAKVYALSGERNVTHIIDNEVINICDATETEYNKMQVYRMEIKIGDKVLSATLVDNSSVKALIEVLSEGPITVNMRDYGNMEKVGSLGQDFPRNDESITAEAGDIILFQGSALVIYYESNSWNFTRLGKIDNITQTELREILGEGNVTVTLSLPQD